MPTRRQFLTHASQGLAVLTLAPALARAAESRTMNFVCKARPTTVTYKAQQYAVELTLRYKNGPVMFTASTLPNSNRIPILEQPTSGTAAWLPEMELIAIARPTYAAPEARASTISTRPPVTIPAQGGAKALRLYYTGANSNQLLFGCDIKVTLDTSALSGPAPLCHVTLEFSSVT